MKQEMNNSAILYTRPMVLSHQPIQFETAQSWNKGKGNRKHHGKGNHGKNYPHKPYTGRRPKDWF